MESLYVLLGNGQLMRFGNISMYDVRTAVDAGDMARMKKACRLDPMPVIPARAPPANAVYFNEKPLAIIGPYIECLYTSAGKGEHYNPDG